jgi:hypothetical protein
MVPLIRDPEMSNCSTPTISEPVTFPNCSRCSDATCLGDALSLRVNALAVVEHLVARLEAEGEGHWDGTGPFSSSWPCAR